jgi:uncharacterized DUF497 family protein
MPDFEFDESKSLSNLGFNIRIISVRRARKEEIAIYES